MVPQMSGSLFEAKPVKKAGVGWVGMARVRWVSVHCLLECVRVPTRGNSGGETRRF